MILLVLSLAAAAAPNIAACTLPPQHMCTDVKLAAGEDAKSYVDRCSKGRGTSSKSACPQKPTDVVCTIADVTIVSSPDSLKGDEKAGFISGAAKGCLSNGGSVLVEGKPLQDAHKKASVTLPQQKLRGDLTDDCTVEALGTVETATCGGVTRAPVTVRVSPVSDDPMWPTPKTPDEAMKRDTVEGASTKELARKINKDGFTVTYTITSPHAVPGYWGAVRRSVTVGGKPVALECNVNTYAAADLAEGMAFCASLQPAK